MKIQITFDPLYEVALLKTIIVELKMLNVLFKIIWIWIGILGECLSQPSDDGINDRVDDVSQDGEVSLALAEENQQNAAVMQNCFAAMVETLAKQVGTLLYRLQTYVRVIHHYKWC